MAHKLNCWEFHNCGRERGGLMAERLGECPVSQTMKLDGTNGGQAAGRACWKVPNSLCQLNRMSTGKGGSCTECVFFRRVHFEEERDPHRTAVKSGKQDITLTRI